MTTYSVGVLNVNVTAQQDIFNITAPATGIVIIHRALITQSSDVGDAAEEGLAIAIRRGAASTAGSGGTVVTPGAGGATEQAGPAFTGTVRANDTTKSLITSPITLHAESWNVRTAWDFLPTPEMRPIISPSARLTVELTTTPADALTVSATLVFEWLGG